ncbi:hypothetical protein A3D80_00205 [Candidatus Roizmanbacteria bacterium RIFCSPHIGHO2_02_FULL_40_13b]|uniref:UDP-N-acetyl-alpha-D-muramoyl-L-alanyl-L-glutamate epimerase n=1 Tax=Candidatus Roizmanbacteria bacterium RIFCSPHIGHO2_01_FULL_39_24 TaxID=1802032 RepID=A0A1F7GK30_9BACT|nr:MAG: hypothetical protein A2799_00515 [Candidatus Roizmanbacteria bacterium RIFCSPHIGHO2_01_FULL_39_24]OGK28057.1 MAG: hypothetical protein A3D80_00205 [Candidatus Roizmanbacteria bacterium RIFCSPHIGHO2_02_FULL_40_13b]OGK49566.1 MAG: hypothetical protein A3A56_04175 [Candidatus Roizmanbacteria bacterium RIFCSPLOWO2_01_FULL_40_32]OGK56100.1 MAG: hypothetical protein A3H83_03570 [Candidatus Roizmanbacteria bacterium RIFCSPLOWO2_02_FULL_39_8]
MQKATIFEFSSINPHFTEAYVAFEYTVHFEDSSSTQFVEKLQFHSPVSVPSEKTKAVEYALQAIHLILGISYYKLYCPKEIRIVGYSLGLEQAEFWNTVYTKGLGEFFYKNNIDFRGLVKFPTRGGEEGIGRSGGAEEKRSRGEEEKALILHGGGKDSIVSVEMMKSTQIPFHLFALNPTRIQEDVANVMQKEIKSIKRELDPKLSTLTEVYQGHIPISVIYAFTALLYGLLFDYTYIIASNEASSSYGSVEYLGMEVNHQWSKSLEFENLLREYVSTFISTEIEYFSLLRPYHEIEIAKKFAAYPKYFTHFSSSNHNFTILEGKEKRWDLEYSKGKVEFAYAILAAFLSKKNMDEIFEFEPFALESTLDKYKELLGTKGSKPLDCVGTPQETKVALLMAHEKGEYVGTPVMNYFEQVVLPTMTDIESMKKEVFKYGNSSNIPQQFSNLPVGRQV